jgi:hypothetical protein
MVNKLERRLIELFLENRWERYSRKTSAIKTRVGLMKNGVLNFLEKRGGLNFKVFLYLHRILHPLTEKALLTVFLAA